MPKKTRQEKIIARLRRLENAQNLASENLTSDLNTEKPKIPYEIKTEPSQTSGTQTKTWDYSYVYKELTQSLTFAVVAIIFQIILAIFIFK